MFKNRPNRISYSCDVTKKRVSTPMNNQNKTNLKKELQKYQPLNGKNI